MLGDGPYAGRTLIVLNPGARHGDPRRVRRLIGGALAVRDASFDIQETRAAGDAVRLARDAAELGYRCVIAAGGDGTLAEVITGLAGSTVPVGILPLGTANQVAANLRIPAGIENAIEVAVNGVTRPIDIARLSDGHYFALMAGAGWDAEVMGAATRELKEHWGFGAYLMAGLRRSVVPASTRFHITIDGVSLEVQAATVIVANVGQLVYDLFPLEFRIAPRVSFDDGLLDICIFAPRNLSDVAAVLWRVARRRYTGDDRMIYLQAQHIRIETDEPVVTQVDGDLHGHTPLDAHAVPGGVQVMVPRDG